MRFRVRYLAIPVCAVVAVLASSRLRWPGSEGDVPQEVGAQEAKWKAHAPAQYILTVTHVSGTTRKWFTLSQVNSGKLGNVLCRRYDANDSVSECAVSAELYPITIEQVFEGIEGAYRAKFRGVKVQYDAQTGAPTVVQFAPAKEQVGEWGYEVEVSTAGQETTRPEAVAPRASGQGG